MMACVEYILSCYSMFIFSEFNSISKAEISELIETKTKMIEAKYLSEIKMMEAKYLSEIKLIKAKCLSKAEIIEIIESKIESPKLGSTELIESTELIDCPENNHLFRIVDGICMR